MTARLGAFGACTAIGRTALETAMAHRAHVGALRVVRRGGGRPPAAIALGGDDPGSAGDHAAKGGDPTGGIEAAVRAWREAMVQAVGNGLDAFAASAPVVLAIPDDVELHVGERTVAGWGATLGVTVPRDGTTIVRGGATASARAIEAAFGVIAAGAAAVWVVGASVPGRGPAAGPGRRLGEGGGALLLLGAAAPAPARPIGRVHAATTAPRDEHGGLLALVERAAAGVDALWVLGELSRHDDAVRETQGLGDRALGGRVEELADGCGELGAAAGTILVAVAAARAATASSPAVRVACVLQNDELAAGVVAGARPARPAEHAVIALDLVPREAPEAAAGPGRSAPAEGPARAAWAAVERALEPIAVGDLALREAEAAWDALCALDDPASPKAPALEAALVRTRRALEAQATFGANVTFARRMRSAERALLDALGEPDLASGPPPPLAPPVRRLRASFGVPEAHAIEPAPMCLRDGSGRRGTAVAGESMADGEDDPEPAEEAEPPSSAAITRRTGSGPPPGPASHLPLLVRRLVLDLGRLGVLRIPGGDAPFLWTLAAFDQRLLERLDALSALGARGQGPPGVEPSQLARLVLVSGLPIDDRVAAFGRALALGCFAGERHARAALVALRASLPYVWPACAAAFALGASPDLRGALEELSRDGDPALATLALDVLRARGDAGVAVAVPLLSHPRREVQRAAIQVVAASRDAAPELLDHLLAEHAEEFLGAATALSLAVTGSPAGVHHARVLLDEEARSPRFLSRATAVELLRTLALAGDEEDLARIGALAIRLEAVELIGWFGHLGGVAPLLAEVEAAGRAQLTRRERASRALERILGPLDAGHVPANGPPEAAAWRAAWAERGPRLDPRKRHRFGRLHAAAEVLAELERDGVRPADRALAALEIAILTRTPWWPWTETWIARQRRVLRDLGARARDLAASPLHAPGRWPLASLRPEPARR